MRPFKQILLASIVSFAIIGPAHADLYISRAAGESDYLVQQCARVQPLECATSARLSQAELKHVRRQVSWLYARSLFAYYVATPMPLRQPGLFFADVPTYGALRESLRKLLRNPAGGVVQMSNKAPGARFVNEIIDAAVAHVPVRPPVSNDVPTS